VTAVTYYHGSVDDDGWDAFGILMWLRIGCSVRDSIAVEDHNVSGESLGDPAAAVESELLRRQRCHFTDGFLERNHLLFAHVMAEDAGGVAVAARVRHALARRHQRTVRCHHDLRVAHEAENVRFRHEVIDHTGRTAEHHLARRFELGVGRAVAFELERDLLHRQPFQRFVCTVRRHHAP
jgi:hypothetical protein